MDTYYPHVLSTLRRTQRANDYRSPRLACGMGHPGMALATPAGKVYQGLHGHATTDWVGTGRHLPTILSLVLMRVCIFAEILRGRGSTLSMLI